MSGGSGVSVVIPTMSRPAELALTVASVMAGTVLPEEIVIVDASADERTEYAVAQMSSAFRRVEFLYVRTPPGLPAQRNAGLEAAGGGFMLSLDDDVILEPDFLEELLKAFDDDRVGGACGVITNQVLPGRYVRFLQRVFRQVRYAKRSFFQRSGLPTFLYRPNVPSAVEIMSGGLTLYRRAAIIDFRWDPVFNYFDDDNVSLELGKRGWRLLQWPAARLEHRLAEGARPAPRRKVRRRILEQRLLHRRHLPQNIWNVACYYYSVWGAAAAAALRLKPRLFLGTLLGLWDVLRTRGGRRLEAASGEALIPRPEQ